MSDQIARENAAEHLQKIEDVIEAMAMKGHSDFSYNFQTHCDTNTLNAIINELRKNGFNVELRHREDAPTQMLYFKSAIAK